MLLAQEFDAVQDGVRYISTHRRRLFAPDTLSRVIGYLATAPVAAPGFRTDGAWVWPEALVEHARILGAAPQDQLYEHMRQRWFLLPDMVSPADMAAAAEATTGGVVPDPAPAWDWVHLGGYVNQSGPADVLLRIRLREDGSVAESRYEPTGWDTGHTLYAQQARRLDQRQYVEISGPEAAALNSRLCDEAREAALAGDRESAPSGPPRLARVFDGESPAGTPWFSPGRRRLPEPIRRERVAAYLMSGRLIVRVSDSMPDPLDPRQRLPMSYRTDGVWVWPEALAHYVLTRGVAPELDLLRRIEERGYAAPAVPDDQVPVAASAVKAGPSPRLARPVQTYFWEPSGGIARSHGRAPVDTEVLREDLRWGRASANAEGRGPARGSGGRRPITEAEAVAFIEARWSTGEAVPPLD